MMTDKLYLPPAIQQQVDLRQRVAELEAATCELNGANPFDYLNQLQRHAEQLAERPADWMPWNYRATLESVQLAVC